MSCCEIQPGLHVCRVDGEIKPARKRRRRFWCFGCRKHLMHTLMVLIPIEPSYYGPNFWWECPNCHEDNTTFPGRG